MPFQTAVKEVVSKEGIYVAAGGAGGIIVAKISYKILQKMFPNVTFIQTTPELGDIASAILFVAFAKGTLRWAGFAGAGADFGLNLLKRANVQWEGWGG